MTSYEILFEELPDYFKPVLEFVQIQKAQGHALDLLEENIASIYANFFISTCDEKTIAYYEKILGIVCRFGDTLEYRRSRVMQKFNITVPFSVRFLKERLNELYGQNGYQMEIDSKKSILSINITSDRYGAIDLLYELLWAVLPTHMQIIAKQETTNYISGTASVSGFIKNTFIQTIGG